MSHHTDTFALVTARIAEHTTDMIEFDRIVEILLCHEFYTKRIARHDYGLSNVTILSTDVWSWSIIHNLFIDLRVSICNITQLRDEKGGIAITEETEIMSKRIVIDSTPIPTYKSTNEE